jgi:type IV pilus assembly protein PilV
MKTHTGFTLIEVLVALLILAVGLLGLAALQTSTLKSNLTAYNHGQATQLLYDIADRMRANNCKPNINATTPFTCNYPSASAVANANAVAQAYIISNSNNAPSKTTCSPPTGCTSLVLANNDLSEWNKAITDTLGSTGVGSISSTDNPATVNSIFLISVTWDEDRNGTIDNNDSKLSMSLQL